MGEAARTGSPLSAPDGRIAAIARAHLASLATRNVVDFRETGVVLVDPWLGWAGMCQSNIEPSRESLLATARSVNGARMLRS